VQPAANTELNEERRASLRRLFPPELTPRDGQLDALDQIEMAFKADKRFFVLEGPTGFGKSAVAKAVVNLYGKGFITSPINTLVSQYSQDPTLELAEVRGQSTYTCSVFQNFDCEKAADVFPDHSERCADYILARNAFWTAHQSVTNLHFLFHAPPIEGAVYPRNVLVIDEAHNLEDILISMGRRKITPKSVSAVGGPAFEFRGGDKQLLDKASVAKWLRYLENSIGFALENMSDPKQKRDYESLRQSINFTLDCGDWISWKENGNLVIAPLSAVKAAQRLFRCADRVLFMSATMGDIPLFLGNLGIRESHVAIYKAECGFSPENRKIIFRALGSMSKQKGQPGLLPMLQECSSILKERPEQRGIIHCHSRDLQQLVFQHLQKEFGNRILIHDRGNDRNKGISRLRNSRNGVLCAVAMTEGLDLRDDDARFCIFAKIPWPDLSDPYTWERKRRSQDWYQNLAALAVVQGSGRVVRSETDQADTYIFDSSFPTLLHCCPDWWIDALRPGKRARSVTLNGRDGTVG
jgi:ATP-dependent DNA helicase DinG